MDQLLSLYGLLSVLIRCGVLGFQSLTVGGVVFLLVVVRPTRSRSAQIEQGSLLWMRRWALALAVTEVAYILLNMADLMRSAGFGFREVVGANFVLVGALAAAASLTITLLASAQHLRRYTDLLVPAAVILAAATISSHAMSRLEARLPLALLTASHQAATAAWIGGLPYLLIALRRTSDAALERELCARFSRLAMISVGVLVAAGLVLGWVYVGSWQAAYASPYGLMIFGKIALLGLLLILGGLNFRIVRSRHLDGSFLSILRRFAEAEIGIGFTAIMLAASLTSLPPAVDSVQESLPSADIVARMMPQWPPPSVQQTDQALQKPAEADPPSPATPASDPLDPPTDPQRPPKYMDDPHHWAAIIVLPVGLLAFLSRAKGMRWAQLWPLLFTGLGVLLFLFSDDQYWPLGSLNIWSSFVDPVVLPHRIIETLIVAFGVFEWKVQTGRISPAKAGLVFPILVALSSALLLTHSHTIASVEVQPELSEDASHIAIAVLGVVTGWSRWLELRLPSGDRAKRVAGWVWPVSVFLVGVVLTFYRES